MRFIEINNKDHCQNLINWFLCHCRVILKISSKSINNFLSNVTKDKQTKASKNHNLLGGSKKLLIMILKRSDWRFYIPLFLCSGIYWWLTSWLLLLLLFCSPWGRQAYLMWTAMLKQLRNIYDISNLTLPAIMVSYDHRCS